MKKELISRLIFSPFMFCIMFIASMGLFIKSFIGYLKWGGEWVYYTSKDEQKDIADIYAELVSQRMANKGENGANKKVIRKSDTSVPKKDKLAKNG